MGYTTEKKGLFVKPERLAVLRSIWADAGIENILDHQVREKLQFELSRHGSDTTLIRIHNPGPLFYIPKPYIVAELGFSYEYSDWDVDTKKWDKRHSVTPVYRLLLDENWLSAKYENHDEAKLGRPESIGNRSSVWSFVDQHIDRARRLRFR